MIKFNHVSKRYLNQLALDNVQMSLPAGKIIGLIGPNGSGKSTMLKLIAGLLKPTKGEVTVLGETANRQIAKSVAYLSEHDTLYPFYTVNETINFYASQFADFNMKKAEEMLGFMKLDQNKKIKELSKGNRGRLKMLLVLSREVPLILMDEPLSGLDPIVRESIVKGMISFIDIEKQTIILTTHEISEVEPLLEMVVAVKEGKVINIADVEELRQTEQMSLLDWMKANYE